MEGFCIMRHCWDKSILSNRQGVAILKGKVHWKWTKMYMERRSSFIYHFIPLLPLIDVTAHVITLKYVLIMIRRCKDVSWKLEVVMNVLHKEWTKEARVTKRSCTWRLPEGGTFVRADKCGREGACHGDGPSLLRWYRRCHRRQLMFGSHF